VYRKPRPFDLTTESLNVDQDGRADISLLELGCLDLQAQSRLEAENAAIVATSGARLGPVHSSSSFIAVSIGPEAMVIMRPETDYERLKA
jgi:hypothetical protein